MSKILGSIINSETLRLFLKPWIGKIGLAMLLILVGISLFVVATMPLDFGTRVWSNPKYWSNNPKAVPPEWVNFFVGNSILPHRIIQAELKEDNPQEQIYRLKYDLALEQFPQTLVMEFNVSINSRIPPSVDIVVKKPDGHIILLYRKQLSLYATNITFPYYKYYRIDVIGQKEIATALSNYLLEKYGIVVSPTAIIGNKIEVKIIFGELVNETSLEFKPLKGTYEIELILHKYNPNDTFVEGSVLAVFMGGCYGLMGTDQNGRDLFIGMLYGFPVALLIGVVTSLITTAIGSVAGIVSGYYGGIVDEIIQRVSDVLNNIPLLPLLIFFVFLVKLPNSPLRGIISPLGMMVIVLIAFGWAGLAIIIRSMVLSIKSQPFIEAAKSVGASNGRIMFKHVFPQVAPFIFAQMIFYTPSAILSEASLSLLGLGDPSIPTWGQILQDAFNKQALYLGQWWWVIPPGLLITYASITFVLIAQALEPIVEPRLRSR